MRRHFQIPVYRPGLGQEEEAAVLRCVRSSWISSKGPFLAKFESLVARFVGRKHAVAVSNGTTALHAALLAVGVGPGDEVVVPSLTYIAPVNAIHYTGARPVFVDSCPRTWQMLPARVAQAIGKKTKAILAVHLYGNPCNLDALRKIARQHRLFLVEDCAEALGSTYRGLPVGKFSAVATYSFFGNKTITTGEGGMITTNQARFHRVLLSLRGQGLAPRREYWHDRIGYNYRMTNICAAIGTVQMAKLRRFLAAKKKLSTFYRQSLRGLPLRFQELEANSESSYWMVSVLCESRAQRDGLRRWLRRYGIETRPLFQPIHLMPMYRTSPLPNLPIAEKLARLGMNLPSHPGLSRRERRRIVTRIQAFFGRAQAA